MTSDKPSSCGDAKGTGKENVPVDRKQESVNFQSYTLETTAAAAATAALSHSESKTQSSAIQKSDDSSSTAGMGTKILRWVAQNGGITTEQEARLKNDVKRLREARNEYRDAWIEVKDTVQSLEKTMQNLKNASRDLEERLGTLTTMLNNKNKDIDTFKIDLNHKEQRLEDYSTRLREMEHQRNVAQDEYDQLVLKQQVESFKALGGSRWIPEDENKVKNDLDSLKGSMKAWARDVATSDPSIWGQLSLFDREKLSCTLNGIVHLAANSLLEGVNRVH